MMITITDVSIRHEKGVLLGEATINGVRYGHMIQLPHNRALEEIQLAFERTCRMVECLGPDVDPHGPDAYDQYFERQRALGFPDSKNFSVRKEFLVPVT